MREYLGIPYKDFGRTRQGLDCWGLCVLVAKEKFGYELPLLLDSYKSAADAFSVSELVEVEKLKGWERVFDYEPGDIVVFNIGGLPCHVGVYVGKNKFIHILAGSEVTIENLDSIVWANRINGVFRKCKT